MTAQKTCFKCKEYDFDCKCIPASKNIKVLIVSKERKEKYIKSGETETKKGRIYLRNMLLVSREELKEKYKED